MVGSRWMTRRRVAAWVAEEVVVHQVRLSFVIRDDGKEFC